MNADDQPESTTMIDGRAIGPGHPPWIVAEISANHLGRLDRALAIVDAGPEVIGTLRLIGDWSAPQPGFEPIFDEMKHMGQELLNPPSVEGWHTGKEWIDGGTLVQRINFIADRVGDLSYPGIQDIIHKLAAEGMTVLVSTHYMDEAERCHEIAYIAYGELLARGTIA